MLIWELCFFGAVPGPLLARELKRAARHVSPDARDLLKMLAAVTHTGARDWGSNSQAGTVKLDADQFPRLSGPYEQVSVRILG